MIRMRCLRDHSSFTYGSQIAGDVFDLEDEGFADHLVRHGLAERVVDPAASAVIEELTSVKSKPGKVRQDG